MSYVPFPGPPSGEQPFPNPLIKFPPQAAIIATGGIIAIDNFTTQITTANPHGYLNGLIVRIRIPNPFQLSPFGNISFPITVTSSTTFTIPFNILPYASINISVDQDGQVIPVAEVNKYLTSAADVIGPNNPP